MDGFLMGIDMCNGAEPALNYFGIDSQCQDIQPGKLIPLPPVWWGIRIHVNIRETLYSKVVRVAQIIFREQFLNKKTPTQPVWRGTDHRCQMGIPLRRGEHLFRFRKIHSHPRLRKHMFACFESGDRYCGMKIGGRSYPNDINLRIRNEFCPVTVRGCFGHILDTKLLRRFVRGIANRRNFDVRYFLKCWQVPALYNAARAYNSDA